MRNEKKMSGKSVIQSDPEMPYAPEDLWWPRPYQKIETRLMIVDEEKSNSIILEYEQPPSEEEFNRIMQTAKAFSVESGRTDIVYQRAKRKTKDSTKGSKSFTVKLARFREGEIELYCRPPWRNPV